MIPVKFTKVLIELTVSDREGSPEGVIDHVLDVGTLQDAIHDYDSDSPVRVVEVRVISSQTVAATAPTRLRAYRDFAVWSDGLILPPAMAHDAEPDDVELGRGASVERAVAAAESVWDLGVLEQAGDRCGDDCAMVDDSGCLGWALMAGNSGTRVERLDDCALFETDDDALEEALALFDRLAEKS